MTTCSPVVPTNTTSTVNFSSELNTTTTDLGLPEDKDTTSRLTDIDIVHCTILAMLGFLAVFTNCLSLLAMFKSRWMRHKSVVILASLAVADLLSGITSPIMIYSWYVLSPTEYFLQNLLDAFVDFPIYASVFHIVLVGLDRFVAINFPLKYDVFLSRRKLGVLLCIIWSVSMLRFALLPFNIGAPEETDSTDEEEDAAAASGVTFFSILEFSIYMGLLLLIVHLYGRLWWIARDQERKIHALRVSAGSSSCQPLPHNIRSKANKTCGCILVAFVCCWMPYLTARLVEQAQGTYDPDNMSVLLESLLDFCKGSSCVNFFIYTWTSNRFRAAYKRILRGQMDVMTIGAENTENTM